MKYFFRISVIVLILACTLFAQNGGYAVKFDGSTGYASATINSGNTNSTMTMEFWFARVSDQAGTIFLGDFHSISGTNRRRVMPFISAGAIGVYAAPHTGDDNNAIQENTGVIPALNVWTHVAVTISGSTLKMYVNGKLYITTSLTDSYALTGTEQLSLAADYWNSSYANVKMDEVRIWSSERTQAQIQANMYKELGGGEANLLAYYKMSDGSGTTVTDNSTSASYSATLHTTLATSAYWIPSGAFADSRECLEFNGTDNYVDCGNGANIQFNGTQSFTVEAWVKPTAAQWGSVISKFQHHSTHEGYSLEMFSDYRISLLLGNNWSDWDDFTSTNTLTVNTWNHIAATYDGSTVKLYINGRLETSAAWTNGITDSGTDLVIGARMGTTVFSTFFLGNIDEARVWGTALSEAQIRESMCRPLSGTEAGLKAYYRLDEIDGNISYDYSSDLYNGTQMNNPNAVTSDAFDVWIGETSDVWAAPDNWSKGSAPTSSQNAGIYAWLPFGNDAAINANPTVGNLLISSTSSPTLNSAITVNGNLLLEKNFDLNGNNITLGTKSYLVEGSGRLSGTTGTISTTRTLGSLSAVDIASLGAKITTSSSMGSTTITRGHAVQSGNSNSSIARYYDITPTNNSSLNATLVFNYNDAELNSLTESTLVLFKSTDSGTSWTNQSGTVSTGNNTVTKTGIGSFSRWTLGSTSSPLSVPPSAPTANDASSIATASFSANWSSSSGATKYYLDVSTNNTFSNYVTGYNNLDVGNVTTYTISGLNAGVTYYYRVRAYNDNGTSGNSNTITTMTLVAQPVLSNIEEDAIQYLEGADAVQITNSITITDDDDTNMESASIRISGNYKSGKDTLLFTDQNGITGSWDSASGKILLSGSSSKEYYQTALRTIKYKNMSSKPDTSLRTISFTVNDGQEESNTLTRDIQIMSVNSAPILDAIVDKAIKEDSTFSIILNASDSDADSINYTAESSDTNAVVTTVADSLLTITPRLNWYGETNITVFANDGEASDTTSFKLTVIPVNDAPVLDSISNKTTNEDVPLTIILSASDVESDSIIYSAISDTSAVEVSVTDTVLTITSKKDWNGFAIISIITSDGKDSNTTDFELTVTPVNDPPVISKMETEVLKYIIKGGGLSITNSLEVTDADNDNIKNAVIIFSKNYLKGEDKLLFEEQNGITGSWNNETGVLVLSGTTTTSNYQTAIKSVQYKNTYLTPTEITREITITVSDSTFTSNTAVREIIITGSSTAPVLSKIENDPVEYKKGESNIVITSTIEVTDADNEYLFEGNIAIDSGYVADEDILEFVNTATIVGSYDSTTGNLTLKGQATIGEYQSAFRSIKYNNTKGLNAESSTRRIIFTVRDGEWLSNKEIRKVQIVSPLKTPSNLTAEVNSNWEVELNWQDNSNDELGFEITRFGNNLEVKDSVEANVTTYKDKDVLEGYRYEYCVLAYLIGTPSDTTSDNQNSVLIPLRPPTDLKAEVDPLGEIKLSWIDNSTAEMNYIVERSEETQDNFQEIKYCDKDTCCCNDKNIVNGKKYYYRVYAKRYDMLSEYSNVVEAVGVITEVAEDLAEIPKENALYNNYPNPFNPTTVISYDLPCESRVKLSIYNILGEEVAVLKNTIQSAGRYKVDWDASKLSSGIYFYRITTASTGGYGNFVKVMKMLLVK
jgi:hypothetical protein